MECTKDRVPKLLSNELTTLIIVIQNREINVLQSEFYLFIMTVPDFTISHAGSMQGTQGLSSSTLVDTSFQTPNVVNGIAS